MKNITISMEMSQHGLSEITSATDYIFLIANFYLIISKCTWCIREKNVLPSGSYIIRAVNVWAELGMDPYHEFCFIYH